MDTARSSLQEVESSMKQEPLVKKRMKPQKEKALNCPRCTSTNTKFCYYNNYSLSQPRHFCKDCKRYWTEGGSLRNVPVGGGSRKNNKRSTTLTAKLAASVSSSLLSKQHGPQFKMTLSNNSSNLRAATCTQVSSAVSSYQTKTPLGIREGGSLRNQKPGFDLLRSEISARILDPFVLPAYWDGFGLQELKRFSNMKLPMEEDCGNGYGGNMPNVEGVGGCGLQFPFKDLKLVPMSKESGEVMENGTETSLLCNGGRGSL